LEQTGKLPASRPHFAGKTELRAQMIEQQVFAQRGTYPTATELLSMLEASEASIRQSRRGAAGDQQAETDQEMLKMRARHEVEQLEQKQAHGEPLSTSEAAFYQNSVGKDVHQAGDSSLESRFQGVIRKSEEESRQRDYDYNKEGTESLRTRP